MGRGRAEEGGEVGRGVGGWGEGEGRGGGGWRRSEGVKKDLKLTRETVGKLKDLRRGMEDLRSELIGYRCVFLFLGEESAPGKIWREGKS